MDVVLRRQSSRSFFGRHKRPIFRSELAAIFREKNPDSFTHFLEFREAQLQAPLPPVSATAKVPTPRMSCVIGDEKIEGKDDANPTKTCPFVRFTCYIYPMCLQRTVFC